MSYSCILPNLVLLLSVEGKMYLAEEINVCTRKNQFEQSDISVIPWSSVFCDNDQYTFLEYNPKDNGVIFLLVVHKNSKNSKSSIIFKRTVIN